MISREALYIGYLAKYPVRVQTNHADGGNFDIQQTILRDMPKALEYTKALAPHFRGHTDMQTAENVWHYLRNQQTYQRDSSGQDIRLPNYFVKSGKGDCKSYSLFAASIFKNLGLPCAIRFTSYDSNPNPSHVYNYIFDRQNKKFVPVDGCYKHFGSEKPYKTKKDYTMRIRTIGSIGGYDYVPAIFGINMYDGENNEIGKLGDGKLKKKIKDKLDKATDKLKKAVNTGKTVVLTVPRVAFLGLVKINVHGIANQFQAAIEKDKFKVQKFWNALGGDFAQFVKVVDEGAKKKKIFGIAGRDGEAINSVTIAAALTAAAPVIVIAIKLLKEINPKAAAAAEGLLKPVLEAAGQEIEETPAGPSTPSENTLPLLPDTKPNESSFSLSPIALLAIAAVGGKLLKLY